MESVSLWIRLSSASKALRAFYMSTGSWSKFKWWEGQDCSLTGADVVGDAEMTVLQMENVESLPVILFCILQCLMK